MSGTKKIMEGEDLLEVSVCPFPGKCPYIGHERQYPCADGGDCLFGDHPIYKGKEAD
jgi:hypothetical protein